MGWRERRGRKSHPGRYDLPDLKAIARAFPHLLLPPLLIEKFPLAPHYVHLTSNYSFISDISATSSELEKRMIKAIPDGLPGGEMKLTLKSRERQQHRQRKLNWEKEKSQRGKTGKIYETRSECSKAKKPFRSKLHIKARTCRRHRLDDSHCRHPHRHRQHVDSSFSFGYFSYQQRMFVVN